MRIIRTVLRAVLLSIAVVALAGAEDAPGPVAAEKSATEWTYLDNGSVRIGIDLARGACIGYFAESATKRNLLNHYDEGRFVQQSFYGDPDGSKWSGKPWVYNPIQGGNWQGKRARTLASDISKDRTRLASRTEPVNWAGGERCPEMLMEQTITLDGAVATIHFRMTYTGESHKTKRHQELPAVFVDAALANLAFVNDGKLVKRVPGFDNESGDAEEEWVAYLDDKDWGIGVYVPGTTHFTSYRRLEGGTMGPKGSACSYVAPVRTMRLEKGMELAYEVYLTIGTLAEIRERFAALRK